MLHFLPISFQSTTPYSVAFATADRLWLASDNRKSNRSIEATAQTVVWSPDGSRIAFIDRENELFSLDLAKSHSKPEDLNLKASRIVWTTSGQIVAAVPKRGINLVESGKPPVQLLLDGESPSISPDGTMIAFVTTGKTGGVWTARIDGSLPRRRLHATQPGDVSWSYDGRWIAAVTDGHLRLVHPNGMGSRDVGKVEGNFVRWSGGSALLAAKRDGQWAVWNFGREAWSPLDLKPEREPEWIGPNRLLGIRNDKAAISVVDGSTEEIPPVEGLTDPLVAVNQAVGAYMGQGFPDPFASAPRPGWNQTVWQGHVESSDPIDGNVTIRVDRQIEANGRTDEYGQPQTRRATYHARLSHRLTVLPETELAVVLTGGRITDAFFPDSPTTEPVTSPMGHVLRYPRATEYDGISRERVVVPMIYPMPGKRRFVDTFLAPRDNGARRHHGNDLMAAKMTPLLAVFDGTVHFRRQSRHEPHNTLSLVSDDNWIATYMHINNDNPGTNDGEGSMRYAFPADLQDGDRVHAGQLIAYCGNSGNAEHTDPHCHFELYDGDGQAGLDPAYSLRAATHIPLPRYSDPDPALRARGSEIRWDALVTDTFLEKRTIVAELTGVAEGPHWPHANTKPKLVYLKLPPGTLLKYRGNDDLEYPLDSVRPGLRISAVGRMEGTHLLIRSCSIALP